MRRPPRLLLAVLAVPVALLARTDAAPATSVGPAELDAAIGAQLKAAGATAAPDCGDALWLRRASYDLTGGPLSAERAKAFLDDQAPDKRARLVRELLASPEARIWWGRFLLEATTDGGRAAEQDAWDGAPLLSFFVHGLEQRRGVDALVRDLLTATGNRTDSPQVQWLLRWNVEPAKLAGSVGRDLLGVQVACAQCHDHPFDTWKQDDFWSLAAFFARTRYYEGEDVEGVTENRRASKSMRLPDDPTDVGAEEEEELQGERRPKKRFQPRFLDGQGLPPGEEPRAVLAARVTASPLFARNLANRVWARLLGRGLVEPVDTAGAAEATDPWVAGVLDPLAARLRGSRFDLLDLVQTIVSTKAYARGPAAMPGPDAPFARHRPRALTADQLRTTLIVATGVYEDDDPLDEEDEGEGEDEGPAMTPETPMTPGMTPGTTAPGATPAPEPAKAEDDEGEGEDEADDEGEDEDDGADPAMPAELDHRLVSDDEDLETPRQVGLPGTKARSLALLSSAFAHEAAESGARLLTKLHGRDVGQPHLERAWLSLLGRRPTAAELQGALAAVAEGGGRRRALEDVIWSIFNSAELGAVW